ncbi:MAG: AI-2E family transporter [Pseudomonadota bacterium]
MALGMGEQVRWWTLGLAALIGFMWLLGDSLLPFLAGAALAYLLDPAADRLEARGVPRILAALLITVLVISAIVAMLLILVPSVAEQLGALIEQAPVYAQAIRDFIESRFPEQLESGSPLARGLDALRGRAEEWSVDALKSAWTGGMAVVDFLMLVIITPVVAFYLLIDWDRLIAKIDSWIPRDHVSMVRGLARDVDSVLAGFVRGQLTVCAILGAFYALALVSVGLDFGLMIGLFAGLISFIPFVGAIFGGALSIGVALFQFWNDPIWILAVAAIFVVGQTVEGNVLTPWLVGGSVGLHPVALMFALSAFGSLMGFTGLLIAVPTAAAIGVLGRFAIDRYKEGGLYQGVAGQLEAEAQAELAAFEADPPASAGPGDEEDPGR